MKRCICFLLICLISLSSYALPTLIHNVKGYTFEKGKLVQFDSLLFDQGIILAIGTKDKLEKQVKLNVAINGNGKTMLPGLIDAHGHILGLGNNLQLVQLRNIGSITESVKTVLEYADKNPNKRWVLGRGWNQVLWEKKQFPNKNDLDKLISDKPVWLRRIDGHAGWANSKALEIAGITKDTPDPQGGKVLKDANGEPTGILIDTAMGIIEKQIPPLNKLERQNALEIAFEHLIELGITSVHDAGIGFDTYKTLLQMSERKEIPIRLYGMLSGSDKNLDAMLKYGKVIEPFLRIQSVKLYSDGALGSRGAALKTPYTDDPDNSGLLFVSDKEMQDSIAKIADYGFQVNVHAIGDKANQQVLDAFAKLPTKQSGQVLRHRIEHAQIVDVLDIPRFKELNIIASMQPTHATSDMNMAEDRLGPLRIKGAYAWRKMLDNEVLIAAGSDFPVELANPFHGFFSSVKRQSQQGNPKQGWYPEENLTLKETLKSFTIDAAYAGFWETEVGSLEIGKKADFIIIDKDIFAKNVQDIWNTKVLETWINGKQVYKN